MSIVSLRLESLHLHRKISKTELDKRLKKGFKEKVGYVLKLWLVKSILIVFLGSRTDQFIKKRNPNQTNQTENL